MSQSTLMLLRRFVTTVQSGGDLGFASIQTFGEDEGRAEFLKKAIWQEAVNNGLNMKFSEEPQKFKDVELQKLLYRIFRIKTKV